MRQDLAGIWAAASEQLLTYPLTQPVRRALLAAVYGGAEPALVCMHACMHACMLTPKPESSTSGCAPEEDEGAFRQQGTMRWVSAPACLYSLIFSEATFASSLKGRLGPKTDYKVNDDDDKLRSGPGMPTRAVHFSARQHLDHDDRQRLLE